MQEWNHYDTPVSKFLHAASLSKSATSMALYMQRLDYSLYGVYIYNYIDYTGLDPTWSAFAYCCQVLYF